MAKVRKTEVRTTTVVEVVEPGVTLELNEDEALTLQLVLAFVGGPPQGPRGHIESIFDGLTDAGFNYQTHPAYGEFSSGSIQGHIVFNK